MHRENQFGWLPFIIPLMVVVLFGIAPLMAVLWHSFSEWSLNNRGHFTLRLSLEAYTQVFQPHRVMAIRRILGRALIVSTAAAVIVVPIAFLLVRCYSGTLRMMLLFLITLPLLTSDVVRAFAWRALLQPTGLLFEEAGVVVALAGSIVSLALLPVVRSLESINPSLWQASAELNSSQWAEFRHVAFPLCGWAVFVGWLVSCVVALGSSVEVEVLAGTTKSSIGAEISSLLSAQKLNVAYAFSVVVITSATLAWGIIWLSLWLLERRRNSRQSEVVSK
jgi:ABC-type spermidine/putrescine transport system permease subunit I